MKKYIFKRILLGLLVLAGVVTITFFLTRVLPSNPAAQWVGPRATPEQIAAAIKTLGLDKPLIVQYKTYVLNLLKGDLGVSLRSKQPVLTELKTYVPPTLELVLISTVFAVIIGIPLGLYSAKKKDKLLDHFCRFFSVGAVSLPTFWVALFLQLIFYRWLQLLPLGGQLDAKLKLMYEVPKITGMLTFDTLITGNMTLFVDALKHIILPGITISLYPIGLVARMTRSALLEILGEDYIKAAKSYGLKDNLILWKYALKNSLGTTATVLALSVGYTLVDTFLVEAIFNWPGVGNYISTAVMSMDYPAIIGVTLLSASSYVILNLIADIIIAVDPRVRT
ncbi:MAG TPA: ABC transporter permease [Sedimentibacter sp.]|nr:ABC transporter permease [Sedimentibacter sp.]HHY99598.1 ABC transporter permease [Tissierellia bacterium]HOK49390.1 ABC transporter permease [Sedimentibacter sp.]HOW22330.1 ABC transporter permease [Sedimentibacter sp.]HRC80947.1 ABC transporter permease [Sedimentibacter sp.]